MPTENRQIPHQVRQVAPLPAGFKRTPEWHRARAALLRWLSLWRDLNLTRLMLMFSRAWARF
jgi:hypothetical protein